ncbi:MAG: hypothetical protein JRI46_04070 [Deltaproteobacteria bacterium]|nr:hypothetical protein [Deltaproteobacteria bacterium]
MEIKEFSVMRYGPLPNTGRISLHNFNLFFGKNEDGKTLTIDALVKLLLGRNIRDFEYIDRVEENPEGYVIIEGDEGKEIKLPEKGNLTNFTGLTSSECRNIFIIRNSDLSIYSEGEFYTHVTDRLTGLRTKEISSIKKKLQELGRLTRADSSAGLSDREDFGNIKSKVENAHTVIEKIDDLQGLVKEEKFDELEEESVRQREEIERIEQEIERLEDARKREKYEKGNEALDKLKEALDKLNELKFYNEDDEQLWRDCGRDIQSHKEEKGNLVTKLRGTEKELKETDKNLREKERDFQIFEERKKRLDEVRTELNLYEVKRGEWAQKEQRSRLWSRLWIISAILLGVSLLGLTLRPSLPFYILGPLFFISTIVLLIPKFQFVRDKAWLAGAFERIKLTLSKFELSAETIEGINSNIQQFEEEHSKKADEIQEITRRKENLEDRIVELQDKTIPSEEKRIKDAQEQIDNIRRKSRVESWDDYSKGLKLKQQYEKSLGEERGILLNLLGTKGETLGQNIFYWDREIKALEEYQNKSKEIEYDESTVSKLKEEKVASQTKLAKLNDKMVELQKYLEDIERDANKVLQLEANYLHCKTSVDLDAVRNELQEFINENETNKDAVLKVMKVFEEIEVEEKEKVSELFGKDSPISKYFNGITNGLYEEVLFNQERGKIAVRRRDGVILEAEKLSGGAYDQLYLSIRLALGEKILKGKKGFFIMDDPFVKADPDRLQRQIEMLNRISGWGWQVIYFSAKGEIKDVLKKNIDSGAINYVEVQGIFA